MIEVHVDFGHRREERDVPGGVVDRQSKRGKALNGSGAMGALVGGDVGIAVGDDEVAGAAPEAGVPGDNVCVGLSVGGSSGLPAVDPTVVSVVTGTVVSDVMLQSATAATMMATKREHAAAIWRFMSTLPVVGGQREIHVASNVG
jgi:hypothetical protein